MRSAMLAALVAVLLAASLSEVSAVGKITVDPNAPGPAKVEAQKPDTRLDQKVTYEARRRAVRLILDDLAGLTDVTLKAGYNNLDWQVRDRKMNIFVKDLPLRDLMNSIARVMKFKWETGAKSNAASYRLYMDRKTLLGAEAERVRAEQRLRQDQAEKREKMLADFGKLDSLSPEELAKLKQDAPFMYVLSTTGLGGALARFVGSIPAVSDAIATGQPLSLTAGSLSPGAQQTISEVMRGTLRLASMMTGKEEQLPQYLIDNIPNYTIGINAEPMGMAQGSLVLCQMSLRYERMNMNFEIPNPSGKLAAAVGKLVIDSSESGRPLGRTNLGQDMPEIAQAALAEVNEIGVGEKPAEHPDDPALKTKIKLAPKGKRLDEVESALMEASGFCVVSDSFGSSAMIEPSREEAELKQVLEGISQGFQYNWEKNGQVIELRDRYWYCDRAAQLPDAWLDQWRDALKKTGTLDLPDLARIAALTQEQFNLNIQGDEVLGNRDLADVIYVNRDILRLFASLDSAQQAAAFAESGLDLMSLSGEQSALGQKLLTRRGCALPQTAGAAVKLTAVRSQKEKRFEYVFTTTIPDLTEPLKWQFTTPKYAPPPNPPAKTDENNEQSGQKKK